MVEIAKMCWAGSVTIRTISNYKASWHEQSQNAWEEVSSKPKNHARSLTIYWVIASEEEHTEFREFAKSVLAATLPAMEPELVL